MGISLPQITNRTNMRYFRDVSHNLRFRKKLNFQLNTFQGIYSVSVFCQEKLHVTPFSKKY